MTLILTLENVDHLDTGGPVSLPLDGRELHVGRRNAMDWVLPDPSRLISGHHFTLRMENGQYWLIDMSTNGTYLQGQSHRLQAPHPLRAGERFLVGRYVIVVQEQGAALPPSTGHAMPAAEPAAPASDDPWDFGFAPAVAATPLAPASRSGDIDQSLGGFVPLASPAPQAQPQGWPAPAPMPMPAFPQGPEGAAPRPDPIPPLSPPEFMSGAGPQGGPPNAPEPRPFVPQRSAEAPPRDQGQDILQAFCEGAGLDPELAKTTDPLALARSLGEASQVSTALIMAILRERAHVKQFTRSGERTMRAASGNNPLKFIPNVDEAVTALFLQPRDGFQSGAEGVGAALRDIQRHQQAIFAALQPALSAVLKDLSPEEVEEGLQGGILPGARKGRAWDEYVSRWDKRAASGENGMLDVFLEAFAQAYAQAHSDHG
ncbi:type VI secretion system-associated FHA domain protein TagH [Thioclava sp. GXIMD4216]|uniref:type VI secretion system-associated FHA domain protein TagH n=1 Tax=Thioclava sp. GXIMD4216 TaxID=3131929 RepID=UPI0030D449CF